jgi:hypothetical protein
LAVGGKGRNRKWLELCLDVFATQPRPQNACCDGRACMGGIVIGVNADQSVAAAKLLFLMKWATSSAQSKTVCFANGFRDGRRTCKKCPCDVQRAQMTPSAQVFRRSGFQHTGLEGSACLWGRVGDGVWVDVFRSSRLVVTSKTGLAWQSGLILKPLTGGLKTPLGSG